MTKYLRFAVVSVVLLLSGCGGGGNSASGGSLFLSGTWSWVFSSATPGFAGTGGTATLTQNGNAVTGTFIETVATPPGFVDCNPSEVIQISGQVSGNTFTIIGSFTNGSFSGNLTGTSTSLTGAVTIVLVGSPCGSGSIAGTVTMNKG